MRVSVTDAKAQLTELVRRAEHGEEIVLTRHGKAVIQFTPVKPLLSADERLKIIKQIQASAKDTSADQTSAARSQDFLYNENGLPS